MLHELLVELARAGFPVNPDDRDGTIATISIDGRAIGWIDRSESPLHEVKVTIFAPDEGIDYTLYTLNAAIGALERIGAPEPREYIDLGEIARGVWNKSQRDLYAYES